MTQTKDSVAAGTGIGPGTYGTLLVHAEPGLAATHRVEAAARLARDLKARLIGVGAEALEPIPAPDPFTGYVAGEWVVLAQAQLAKNLEAAEAAFQRDAAGADIEWRTLQDYPSNALTRLARTADLIVMSPRGDRETIRTADPADVVMGAGRPVLIAPDRQHHLQAKAIVIAWKDTRECRRAVADAMPFLRSAEDVIVHTLCAPDSADAVVFETDDVVANLRRHGVPARALVTSIASDDVVDALSRVAELNHADLIVAGAYGHSRLREWAFGGVTQSFLRDPPCFVLMSH